MAENNGNIINRLAQLDEQESKLKIERALSLEKALHSQDVDTIYKAQKYYTDFMSRNNPMQRQPNSGVKALIMDPMQISSSQGYYNKATMLSFSALRAMSRVPVIRAIINTRKDQVAEFCKPQPDKYSKGFVLEKDGVDDSEGLSDGDLKMQKYLTGFLLNCGEDESKWKWDDFETTIRKFVEDSLVLDQGILEVIPQRNFVPYSFVAVDGATIRIADSYNDQSDTHEGELKVNGEYPSYVQVYQGVIIREFYPWEMAFCTRNVTTDIYSNGYGRAELEDLIQTITAIVNSDTYNANFFRQGTAPKGALLVKKSQGMNPDTMAQFKRDWNALMSGVTNAHKTPILDAESFEWLDLQKTNRDMEFSKFQEWLIKLICGVFKISPEEIGFPLEGQGSNKLGSDNGSKEKQYSIDKGLKPLLTHIEKVINKFIIGPKSNGKWKFRFAGLDVESAQEEQDRLQKEVVLFTTVDEARKIKGMKPLPNGMGKLPLNPLFFQMQQMGSQQQQEQLNKQEEKDKEDKTNSNPFLDDEENPFSKAYVDWLSKRDETVIA